MLLASLQKTVYTFIGYFLHDFVLKMKIKSGSLYSYSTGSSYSVLGACKQIGVTQTKKVTLLPQEA